MFGIIILLTIISVFSLVFTEEFEPLLKLKDKMGLGSRRLLKSKYLLVDFNIYVLWKLMNCAPCLSYHLTWFLFLVFGSCWGFLFGFITYLITKWLYLKIWGLVSF